jgi:hypothetical protein
LCKALPSSDGARPVGWNDLAGAEIGWSSGLGEEAASRESQA